MGLAADLVQVIHSIWRQPNNEPVVKTIVERMKPFYNGNIALHQHYGRANANY